MVPFSSHEVVNFFKQKYYYLSENIAIFHSNDNFFTQHLFLNEKSVIRWLFHDHLRPREREREEKGTTNSAPKCFFRKDVYFLCFGFHLEVKVLQTTFFNITASLLFEHQMIGGKLLVCQFLLHLFSDE